MHLYLNSAFYMDWICKKQAYKGNTWKNYTSDAEGGPAVLCGGVLGLSLNEPPPLPSKYLKQKSSTPQNPSTRGHKQLRKPAFTQPRACSAQPYKHPRGCSGCCCAAAVSTEATVDEVPVINLPNRCLLLLLTKRRLLMFPLSLPEPATTQIGGIPSEWSPSAQKKPNNVSSLSLYLHGYE